MSSDQGEIKDYTTWDIDEILIHGVLGKVVEVVGTIRTLPAKAAKVGKALLGFTPAENSTQNQDN